VVLFTPAKLMTTVAGFTQVKDSQAPSADRSVHLSASHNMISQETRALMTRLARMQSFVLYETMVPAAAPSLNAQAAIESYLDRSRTILQNKAQNFLHWLHSPAGMAATAHDAQRHFAFLRLYFNMVLSHFDIFADVMTQRSEHNTGVWLAGLDLAAADGLTMSYYTAPPVVCYLDRGQGAAIRRARARLPGGGENPVAVIRVPRERMVGSGIASSLIHEVGHQGAALLDLLESMRPALQSLQRSPAPQGGLWQLWERWLSEIVADFWSVSRVGITAPLGLMGVVSLPRVFVFRVSLDDPHPIPWIRVKLSCAMGDALYPHPQWQQLAEIWESFYPLEGLPPERQQLLRQIEAGIPAFVGVLVSHRPRSLNGRSLGETFALPDRQPARLRQLFTAWRNNPEQMKQQPPTLVFAAFGQARTDGQLSPEGESRLLGSLLTEWARRNAISVTQQCIGAPAQAAFTVASQY
jgi:hypothetical protein